MRFPVCQPGQGHALAPGLPRAPEYPEHGPLHGHGTRSLPRVGERLRGTDALVGERGGFINPRSLDHLKLGFPETRFLSLAPRPGPAFGIAAIRRPSNRDRALALNSARRHRHHRHDPALRAGPRIPGPTRTVSPGAP